MNKKKYIIVSVLTFIASIIVFSLIFKSADSLLNNKGKEEIEKINLFATGDSLTEGIGDESQNGGYVGWLETSLSDEYNTEVISSNFGKSGDRTDQVLKRVKENTDLQKSLKSSDIITITIGGNDLMKVFKDNIFNLSQDTFTEPKSTYISNLEKLINELRKHNDSAPIYLLGIYNPFYLSFPNLEVMQDIVDSWNNTTDDYVKTLDNAYFVPINDKLYKGLGVDQDDDLNNLLSKDDSFHPNSTGYQIISNEFLDMINKTKREWIERR